MCTIPGRPKTLRQHPPESITARQMVATHAASSGRELVALLSRINDYEYTGTKNGSMQRLFVSVQSCYTVTLCIHVPSIR